MTAAAGLCVWIEENPLRFILRFILLFLFLYRPIHINAIVPCDRWTGSGRLLPERPLRIFTAIISTPKTKPYHLNWGATREWRWRYQYSFEDGYLMRKRVIVSATIGNTSRARVEHNVSLNSKTHTYIYIYVCFEHNFLLFYFFVFTFFTTVNCKYNASMSSNTLHNIIYYVYIFMSYRIQFRF